MDLRVSGVHITNYFADFYIINNDRSEEIHETKGYWTDVALVKWALSKALYPNIKHVAKYEKTKFYRGFRK
jgi:hypothetical protein